MCKQHFVFCNLVQVLGRGNFGVVYRVFDKKTGEALACKSICKRKLLNQEDMDDVRREIQINLHLSGHPNVCNLRGTYEDREYIHLWVLRMIWG